MRQQKWYLESEGNEVDGILDFVVPDNDGHTNVPFQCRDCQLRNQISCLERNKYEA